MFDGTYIVFGNLGSKESLYLRIAINIKFCRLQKKNLENSKCGYFTIIPKHSIAEGTPLTQLTSLTFQQKQTIFGILSILSLVQLLLVI